MYGHDIRMLESSCGLSLATEALAQFAVVHELADIVLTATWRPRDGSNAL